MWICCKQGGQIRTWQDSNDIEQRMEETAFGDPKMPGRIAAVTTVA